MDHGKVSLSNVQVGGKWEFYRAGTRPHCFSEPVFQPLKFSSVSYSPVFLCKKQMTRVSCNWIFPSLNLALGNQLTQRVDLAKIRVPKSISECPISRPEAMGVFCFLSCACVWVHVHEFKGQKDMWCVSSFIALRPNATRHDLSLKLTLEGRPTFQQAVVYPPVSMARGWGYRNMQSCLDFSRGC